MFTLYLSYIVNKNNSSLHFFHQVISETANVLWATDITFYFFSWLIGWNWPFLQKLINKTYSTMHTLRHEQIYNDEPEMPPFFQMKFKSHQRFSHTPVSSIFRMHPSNHQPLSRKKWENLRNNTTSVINIYKHIKILSTLIRNMNPLLCIQSTYLQYLFAIFQPLHLKRYINQEKQQSFLTTKYNEYRCRLAKKTKKAQKRKNITFFLSVV